MVAKITISKNVRAVLNYNEKKVQKGVAICLAAANYLNDAQKMNFHQKLAGFKRLNELNQRASTKTIHISLNFDPFEKLPENKLGVIAGAYMDKIGFGEQPYLVYKHNDVSHPHIHIVSTTIRENGSRIDTHNIGRIQSEKARKEIENLYGLIKAEKQQNLLTPAIKPVNLKKIIYGQSESRKSISNVVAAVYNQYKFSSLPEFNAALKQFNVMADRGREEGRIFKNGGLVFHILDENNNKIGVPIKASLISCKPLLKNLEKMFDANAVHKENLKQRTKNAVDDCLRTSGENIKSLVSALHQKDIYTVLRENKERRIYGITFVDNLNKVVFNGSDLGKGYSAGALLNSLNGSKENIITKESVSGVNTGIQQKKRKLQNLQSPLLKATPNLNSLMDVLFPVKEEAGTVQSLLPKRKRKKRKKRNDP